MGSLTLKELIVFHKINQRFKRNLNLLSINTELTHLIADIIQHGSLENITKEEIAKVRQERPGSKFPDIEAETKVLVIFPKSFDSVITLEYLEILAFYTLLNENFSYNFDLSVWEHQIDTDTTKFKKAYDEVKAELIQAKLFEKLEKHKQKLKNNSSIDQSQQSIESEIRIAQEQILTNKTQSDNSPVASFLSSQTQTLSTIANLEQPQNIIIPVNTRKADDISNADKPSTSTSEEQDITQINKRQRTNINKTMP